MVSVSIVLVLIGCCWNPEAWLFLERWPEADENAVDAGIGLYFADRQVVDAFL